MKILWLSGRNMGSDLASSTELNLCEGMSSHGHDVKLISPGIVESDLFQHTSVKLGRTVGVQGFLTSWRIKKLLEMEEKDAFEESDIILIDWRLVVHLRSALKGRKWAIIDRGPPARSGRFGFKMRRELFMNIHKLVWKKAWKNAALDSVGGFVVSDQHSRLVREYIGHELSLATINSGSKKQTKLASDRYDPLECLKLCYSGTLDKKRGVDRILTLGQELANEGIKYTITILGEGDCADDFERISKVDDSYCFLGKLAHEDAFEVMSSNHVGIMPMPEKAIWKIASPIKLAEYASSGMAIIGPDHEGNHLNLEGNWIMLSDEENWVRDCASKLAVAIRRGEWADEITRSAVASSEHLSWTKISEKMILDVIDFIA